MEQAFVSYFQHLDWAINWWVALITTHVPFWILFPVLVALFWGAMEHSHKDNK